jgi:hypothetical protein
MPFPWGQSTLPVDLICEFCGDILQKEGSKIIACACPDSIQKEYAEREKAKQFNNSRKITFDEARKKNKRPLRKTDE